MASGEWRTASGERRVASGERRVASGECEATFDCFDCFDYSIIRRARRTGAEQQETVRNK